MGEEEEEAFSIQMPGGPPFSVFLIKSPLKAHVIHER